MQRKKSGLKEVISGSLQERAPILYLFPFLVAAIAAVTWHSVTVPSVAGAVVKCLPVSCLILFLILCEDMSTETARVVAALIFSVVGDAFLEWPDQFFLPGVVFFLGAQLLYISSMGFRRVSWGKGAGVHGAMAVPLLVVLPTLHSSQERIAVILYSITLAFMFWRALDRLQLREDVVWERRACTAAGATSFVVSDVCLGVLQLGSLVPHGLAQFIVLTTYYTGQALLTLGASNIIWHDSGTSSP